MPTFSHPKTGETIEGTRLVPGDKIQEGDCYDSSRGTWEPIGSGGHLTLEEGCTTIWVRPSVALV